MLTNLKKSVVHLVLLLVLATVQVHCSKKQTANTTSTATTSTTDAEPASTDLQKYTGRYNIDSNEISWAEVTMENSKLYGESNGQPKTELINEGRDKFRVQGVDAIVTFTRDSQQQVNGLVISYQGYEFKGEKVK